MNLVLITSLTNIDRRLSVFSNEQRFDQLINLTIPSIKRKIPNYYMILLEGGNLTNGQIEILKEKNIEGIYNFDVSKLHKSMGEANLLYRFLKSEDFKKIRGELENIVKISGRYYLTDEFSFDHRSGENVILKRLPSTTSSKRGLCETRYYKVAKPYIRHFIKSLGTIYKNGLSAVDIEHSFYLHNVVPTFSDIKKVNIAGCVAPTGKFVSE